MAVSPQQVKSLRERTGIGMMECKKALEECNGDMDQAIKVLRERGAIKAAKREDRAATEGLVSVATADDNGKGAIALLSCETDFVSRNDEFAELVKSIAEAALSAGAEDLEAAKTAKLADGRDVQTAVEDIRTKIGEKIELGGSALLSGDIVAPYVHFNGKIGVLIAASAPGLAGAQKDAVLEGLRTIAMHIVANGPQFLGPEDVDPKTMEDEKSIYEQQARNEGKPDAILPKIVEGKMKAFYKQNCLLQQEFAMDTSKTVTDVVKEISKNAGSEVTLTQFVRLQVGSA